MGSSGDVVSATPKSADQHVAKEHSHSGKKEATNMARLLLWKETPMKMQARVEAEGEPLVC